VVQLPNLERLVRDLGDSLGPYTNNWLAEIAGELSLQPGR
jgi:hypothetical protein